MNWTDDALMISVSHGSGETLSLDVLTRSHGRMTCRIRDVGSDFPRLDPGCSMELTVSEAGNGYPDAKIASVTGGIDEAAAEDLGSAVLTSMRSVMSAIMPNGEPVPDMFEYSRRLISGIAQKDGRWPIYYAQWEFALLVMFSHISGIQRCRSAFKHGEVLYFAPRSARLVTRAEAGAFIDRMVPIANFLLGGKNAVVPEVQGALSLFGMLMKRIGDDQRLEEARSAVIEKLSEIEAIPRYDERNAATTDEESFRRRLLTLRPLRVHDSHGVA